MASHPKATVGAEGDALAVALDFGRQSGEWQSDLFLMSDRHFDSTHCNRALLKRHLDEALERNALIVDTGDFFDAMQGRQDKRRSNSGKRPEVATRDDYFGAIIDEAVDFLKPYARNIVYMATGNHETAVIRNTEINPTRLLASRLNDATGSRIHVGGYEGWIFLRYKWRGTVQQTVKMFYTHGTGGECARSKGVLNVDLLSAEVPDADVIVSGHNHQSWVVPKARRRISKTGVAYTDRVLHIKIPSMVGRSGWEAERGHQIKPQGSYWLRIKPEVGAESHRLQVRAVEV